MENINIPYGKQNITREDLDFVITTLQSESLTQGPKINEFESDFARYVSSKYAVAVSNGTAALHLSALSLDVKKGQKIITTTISFAATANCIQYCGGEVVFADVDSDTHLIDYEYVKSLLESSPLGTYAGIIVVDFAGYAVNLEKFRTLADQFGLWIIEDACHAPGGFFIDSKGEIQNCGNGKYADLAIFSFHPVKHITCGEGGMITTNDENLYKKLLKLRSHGITKLNHEYTNEVGWANGENNLMSNESSYPGWYMEMQELGFNYRITDFQAALGISQLKRAKAGVERRKDIAKKYANSFADKNWLIGQSGFIEGHAYHLYVIEVINRLGLYNHLKSNNIFSQVHYIPTHLMPYYRKLGWKIGDLPIAENYYAHCISLPMYPTLTESEQEYVITIVNGFYHE